uniref:GIY-YIG domain-containing protein n=1 Tax=Trichuris muris TaxID=70415 RepID=A0A5S6Q2Y6_TRIMR
MRAILSKDKTVIPLEDKPGVVYAVKCGCGATYIGETGNSIKHRFAEHMKCLQRYLNAKGRAEGQLQRHRGRPQSLEPSAVMAQCIKASAVAEHAATCSIAALQGALSSLYATQSPWGYQRKSGRSKTTNLAAKRSTNQK